VGEDSTAILGGLAAASLSVVPAMFYSLLYSLLGGQSWVEGRLWAAGVWLCSFVGLWLLIAMPSAK
jgi:hypothetical protein